MQAACCNRSFGVQDEEEFLSQPVRKIHKPLYLPSNTFLNTIKRQRTKAVMGFGFLFVFTDEKHGSADDKHE